MILAIAAVCFACASFGQAKKPTLMVVPSDAWCIRNGYVQQFDDQGQTRQIPDYQAAMQQSAEMRQLVSEMGGLMASREFPLKSLEQELKRLQTESAEMSALAGSETGSGITETPFERLKRNAGADIILDIDFNMKRNGPDTQVSFNLTALDAYSSKMISGNTGVGSKGNIAVELLMKEAVGSFIDKFCTDLKTYFDGMFADGREITLMLRCFDSSPINFETEFDYSGQTAELADIIGVWMEENSVNGRFSEDKRSTNVLRYTQVRIPMYGTSLSGKQTALDASGFGRGLVNVLRKAPYNVTVKTVPKGLGEIWLILGEK